MLRICFGRECDVPHRPESLLVTLRSVASLQLHRPHCTVDPRMVRGSKNKLSFTMAVGQIFAHTEHLSPTRPRRSGKMAATNFRIHRWPTRDLQSTKFKHMHTKIRKGRRELTIQSSITFLRRNLGGSCCTSDRRGGQTFRPERGSIGKVQMASGEWVQLFLITVLGGDPSCQKSSSSIGLPVIRHFALHKEAAKASAPQFVPPQLSRFLS